MLTDKHPKSCSPEIWGGIESTINRVGDNYFDQLDFADYYSNPASDAIAALGIQKLRFPILWEKHEPLKGEQIDWRWTGTQLANFRNKNIEIIAGLVHHGSGPAFTDLTDPDFPYHLASYAEKVAAKFPWIEYYTPVNEPLTTARFSGLYGFWYPHGTDDKTFIRCLLNQLKGTVLSMEAIRRINPEAKLIQTEDLGKTYSTNKLRYQANFENDRRWLTYDLLCGRVDEKHKLWKYFKLHGTRDEELEFFRENLCVPNIFGFNHYVTSERYIDEDLERFPRETHGGNRRHRYADVEAVRVELEEPSGLPVLLNEAWTRYEQPIAITEVHLHCHREEQIRWFKYVWNTCSQLHSEGVDIRGVTAWALLGSFGWNKLLTQRKGSYEPGVFEISSGKLRSTALADLIRKINVERNCEHFLSHSEGWWKRSARLIYNDPYVLESAINETQQSPSVIIIGKRGTLGQAFAKACGDREIPYKLLGREDCNIADIDSIEEAINEHKPWAIINAAGFVRVDDAEKDCNACYRDNTNGPANLALATKRHGLRLVTFSSDLVFDGSKRSPYVESDVVNPLNVYGKSKAEAEAKVSAADPEALLVRASAFFGPWDEYNFIHWVETSLMNGLQIPVANDVFVSPTYVPDLVNTTLDLLIDNEHGIWHLANSGSVTWAELAKLVAKKYKLDKKLIRSLPVSEMGFPAPRPLYSVLSSEKCGLMPSLENALSRYFEARKKTGMFV